MSWIRHEKTAADSRLWWSPGWIPMNDRSGTSTIEMKTPATGWLRLRFPSSVIIIHIVIVIWNRTPQTHIEPLHTFGKFSIHFRFIFGWQRGNFWVTLAPSPRCHFIGSKPLAGHSFSSRIPKNTLHPHLLEVHHQASHGRQVQLKIPQKAVYRGCQGHQIVTHEVFDRDQRVAVGEIASEPFGLHIRWIGDRTWL